MPERPCEDFGAVNFGQVSRAGGFGPISEGFGGDVEPDFEGGVVEYGADVVGEKGAQVIVERRIFVHRLKF